MHLSVRCAWANPRLADDMDVHEQRRDLIAALEKRRRWRGASFGLRPRSLPAARVTARPSRVLILIRSDSNSATIARTLKSRRPTRSSGSWTEPPRLSLTWRVVSSGQQSIVVRATVDEITHQLQKADDWVGATLVSGKRVTVNPAHVAYAMDEPQAEPSAVDSGPRVARWTGAPSFTADLMGPDAF
jgi:hypothetical protein